mmetsp:Transcript_23175/g.72364  ORF Transcript_23175/g.72364 Transcript_23175/m.72364 type:complete len:430 (+) Transcript_23175:2471-3760(+)
MGLGVVGALVPLHLDPREPLALAVAVAAGPEPAAPAAPAVKHHLLDGGLHPRAEEVVGGAGVVLAELVPGGGAVLEHQGGGPMPARAHRHHHLVVSGPHGELEECPVSPVHGDVQLHLLLLALKGVGGGGALLEPEPGVNCLDRLLEEPDAVALALGAAPVRVAELALVAFGGGALQGRPAGRDEARGAQGSVRLERVGHVGAVRVDAHVGRREVVGAADLQLVDLCRDLRVIAARRLGEVVGAEVVLGAGRGGGRVEHAVEVGVPALRGPRHVHRQEAPSLNRPDGGDSPALPLPLLERALDGGAVGGDAVDGDLAVLSGPAAGAHGRNVVVARTGHVVGLHSPVVGAPGILRPLSPQHEREAQHGQRDVSHPHGFLTPSQGTLGCWGVGGRSGGGRRCSSTCGRGETVEGRTRRGPLSRRLHHQGEE